MITYPMVVQATHGDAHAMQQVLHHFDAYINSLCTHPFIYDSGRTEYGVDTHMKTYLQGKLLQAMLKFQA